MLAGYNQRDIILNAFADGANDCITLPFDPAIVIALLRVLLIREVQFHLRERWREVGVVNVLNVHCFAC